MTPTITACLVIAYFTLLVIVSYFTGRKAGNDAFFRGNRQSPWYIVSIAMIGTSISGVTFISTPGWVKATQFTYFQMLLGNYVGFLVVAFVLMPLYYRLNLTSIYTYLEKRFGFWSYKSGALLFLVSRTIGAAARLYLMVVVLQISLFNAMGIPFGITAAVTLSLIWLYTFKGGIKTIIWTDMLQSLFLVSSLIITIVVISGEMHLDFSGVVKTISSSSMSRVFVFDDWSSKQFFFKQFFAGAFITIVMTGLDQDMMQKNLTCKTLGDAKKNMMWYAVVFMFINILFLSLGVLLYTFAAHKGIPLPERSDDLFPMLATGGYLPITVGIFFMLGLIAATYSSSDSALTALTTSFSVDILNIEQYAEAKSQRLRMIVHLSFTILLGLVILIFRLLEQDSIISTIFMIAGYTYGPLLGLYAFGLFTKRKVLDWGVPFIALLSPLVCGIVDMNSMSWWGFKFGFEILIINGLITYLFIWLTSKPVSVKEQVVGVDL